MCVLLKQKVTNLRLEAFVPLWLIPSSCLSYTLMKTVARKGNFKLTSAFVRRLKYLLRDLAVKKLIFFF